MITSPSDRDWLRARLGAGCDADDERGLLDAVQTSGLSVAAFDLVRRRVLAVSATGRAVLGFERVDLDALDIVEAADDPDASLRVQTLIVDGQLSEWTYRSWLYTAEGDRTRGIANGRAIDVGQSRPLVLASFSFPTHPAESARAVPIASTGRVPILVAHHDERIRTRIRAVLAEHELLIENASDWAGVIDAADHDEPFVLVIDAQLATVNDLVRLVERRSGLRGVVVIVDERYALVGPRALEAGLDDFIRESTIQDELPARVRAVVRRIRPRPRSTLEFGGLVIDIAARDVYIRRQAIELTAREFDLLSFLALHPNVAFTRQELLEHVWRSSSDWQTTATVTEHVRRIRLKLDAAGEQQPWIRTVPRRGYIFRPQDDHLRLVP